MSLTCHKHSVEEGEPPLLIRYYYKDHKMNYYEHNSSVGKRTCLGIETLAKSKRQ